MENVKIAHAVKKHCFFENVMQKSFSNTNIMINSMGKFQLGGPGPEVIKLFSCSTQLSTKFILLINVKMQTIVGILTLA